MATENEIKTPFDSKGFLTALSFFFLAWAVFFGGLVRLYPAIIGHSPINDGGLFYVMSKEILAANFGLPVFTQFNAAHLPFAYPPLGLYLAALLSRIPGFGLFDVYRLLPPILSTLSIPLMYFLARRFLPTTLQAAFAALAYALIPRGYLWSIMGGGIPRSLGILFSMAFLICLATSFSDSKRRYSVLAAICLALLALTHPEWLFHSVCIAILFWLANGQWKKNAVRLLFIFLGAGILSSPWWILVLSRHGIAPFLSALQTGGFSFAFFGPLLVFNFTEEPYVAVIAFLSILGILYGVVNRKWLLLFWLVVPFIVEIRNAAAVADIPLAILATIGFFKVLFPGLVLIGKRLSSLSPSETDPPEEWIFYHPAAKLFLSFLLVYSLINAFVYSYKVSALRLSPDDEEALAWIREGTPVESRVLAVGMGEEFQSPIQEWLPALTERINPAVAQGYEWVDGNLYFNRLRRLNALNACITQNLICVNDWSKINGVTYDYLLVRTQTLPYNFPSMLTGQLLVDQLDQSQQYRLVYQNPTIAIYQKFS